MSKDIDYIENSKYYSEDSFFQKVKNFASKIGINLLLKAFTLYFVAKDNDTPSWAKSMVYGVLGYLILPIDAIPDFVPFIGFSDDLAAIVTSLSVIVSFIKPEHINMAHERVSKIFNK